MRNYRLLLFTFLISSGVYAQFTPGRLVVVRVGVAGSGTALTSAATPLFIDEFTTTGAAGTTVALPVTMVGNVNRITGSGSATSESALNLSADGSYLTLGGYDAAVGQAGVGGAAGINRVIARIASDGTVATTVSTTTDATAINNSYAANNFRSVITADGSRFWLGGNGTASTGGIRTVSFSGSSTTPVIATQVSNTTTNIRVVNIFNGQLYFSTGSGTTGIYAAGTGLPTSAATIATLKIPATDPYGFVFIDRGGGNLNCYVASGSSAVLKFSSSDNGANWTARGSIAATNPLYGITGRLEGGSPVIYATSASASASSIITLADASAFDATITGSLTTIATSGTNTIFRGLALTPVAAVNNLSLTFTAVAASSPVTPPAITTTVSDPTDPLASAGVQVDVKEDSIPIPSADYTITGTSSNTAIVPNANINITKGDGLATVKVTAAAAGYTDVALTLTKGSFTKTLTINIAASAASSAPAFTRFHTGSSDASAAIRLDDNFMVVADDEMNKLYVYDRNASGLPVTSYNYSGLLGLTDLSGGIPREVDVEAGVRSIGSANRIYWLGSMSNSATSFNARPNRNRLFAVTAIGTGSSTAFGYVGLYSSLRQDLIAWGDAAGYNFTASAAAGKDPKQIDGFNVEGLAFAPDNTTAYIAFRAPLVPTAARAKAVIAPVQNFEAWFNNGSPAGAPALGAPIEVNLGGRGFRDLVRLSNGTYVILAGSYDDMPLNPAIYTWDGLPPSAPVMITSFNLTDLNPEGVLEMQSAGNLLNDRLQILSDNGSVIYYNDGVEAKDLTQNNYKKFRSDILVSGTGNVLPLHLRNFVVNRNKSASVLSWELALPVRCNNFSIERSVDGSSFSAIAVVPAFTNTGDYRYTDAYTATGKTYYRIAAVDANGKKTYSAIRSVNNGAGHDVALYPNPATNGQLTILTTREGWKYAAVFDVLGHKMKEASFTTAVTDLTVGDLPKGNYYLVLSTKEKIIATKPFLVQ